MVTALAAASVAAQPALPIGTAAIVDSIFATPGYGETRAIVVLRDGAPVIERYAPGYGPTNRFISWSMAKSVTSTLVGQLVAEGKLKLDAPAPVAEWHHTPGDPRAKITLAQMLHMESGLKHSETGPPVEDADTNRALFADRSADAAAAGALAPLQYTPGSHYEYSTLTSVMLARIVQQTVAPGAATPDARRKAMRDHMNASLFGPAGLSSMVCEFDAAGTMLGGSFCHATARDWAKFGKMYLDNGKVDGKQVVPASWVAWVHTPAPSNPGYGGQFWLNRATSVGKHPALFPTQGPADLYSAIGHLGQYVMVVPSKHLVVVRLGKTADDARDGLLPALGRLVNSFPDAK